MFDTNMTVRELASGLAVGQTTTTDKCPSCNGGRSKDKAFSVTRQPTGVAYCCHRASCGLKGFVPYNASEWLSAPPPGLNKVKVFSHPTRRLNATEIRFFIQRFGLTIEELFQEGVVYSTSQNRVVFPHYDWRGYRIGCTARGYEQLGWDGKGPKAIYYPESYTVPKMNFPLSGKRSDTCVLVEDTISALKVGRYLNCCAITGSHLEASLTEYLIEQGVKRLIIWLDYDARQKAVSTRQKVAVLFESVKLITTEKDPKDLTDEELKKWLLK